MLFGIDEDRGSWVMGWIMPDNPNATPVVEVRIGDRQVTHVPAMHYRPLLKTQGLHNTGICGFVCDENNSPGLSDATDLAIYSADNNLLLFRRPPPEPVVNCKFLRIETRLFSAVPINNLYADAFQMSYKVIDLLPEETLNAVIGITFTQSIYMTGRILYQPVANLLRDREFKTGIILRDPYEELAERIVILHWAATSGRLAILENLGPGLSEAARELATVDLTSTTSLGECLARLSPLAAGHLRDPLARQLTTMSHEEPLEPAAVGIALETLASFDAVGLQTHLTDALALFEAVIGRDDAPPTPQMQSSNKVLNIAEMLTQLPVADTFLENDLAVWDAAGKAVARARRRR